MADKPYRDPKTTKIEDWKWRPLEQVKAKLAIAEVPDYIQKGFGGFMNEQAGRSQRGEMTPRDLIKAYTIAQSSIGRGGLSHATATKTGMRLPDIGGEVRPEGAFAEWLGSPQGQRYLNAAERGEADPSAIADLQGKFAPFGKHNDQADKMVLAAKMAQLMGPDLNKALTGSADEYRDYAEKMKGIAGAKSGFIGSLLGRGDLPTLDARQLNLHALPASVGIGSIMNRGKGKGAREAVDRLSARQRAMRLALDPSLDPHYQHLAHHAVWDKASGTETTHDDLMRAMRGYAQGGDVEPTPDQMRRELAQREPMSALGRVAAGQAGANLIKKQPQMKASEALGQLMEKGFKKTTTTQADRTKVGGGNIGGAAFSAISEAHPEYAGKVWGVMDPGTASRLTNLTDPETAWTTMLGSATQLKTNPIVFGKLRRAFLKAIKEGKMTPELADKFNHNLKLTLGEGADIRDPKVWDAIDTFEKRAAMADLMMGQGIAPGKGGIAMGGEKSGKGVIFKPTDILKEETERSLMHPEHGGEAPTFAAGPRLFSLSGTHEQRPDLHPGFPTLLHGKDLGMNVKPTPTEVYLPEWHAAFKKANPTRKGPGYYDLALGVKGQGLPSQALHEAYIRHLMREGFAEGGTVGYAEGGEVKAEPSQDEMMAHIMLKGMSNLKDVGANEAPNLKVKSYVPPAGGPGLPVGGVDFQPEAQGQQMMPGQPGQPPGAPGQPAGQMPPSGQPPAPAPNAPRSNILQMTQQGQAMAAMRPSGPPGAPMPKMAGGGTVSTPISQMREELRRQSSEPFDPIGNIKRDVTEAWGTIKAIPGNLQRLARDPAQYVKDLPPLSGEQVMGAFSPSNIGFAGMMIGPKAQTFNMGKAAQAEKMRDAGHTPQEIWKETGTLFGKDGIPRQEISDQNAVFRKPNDIKTLAENQKANIAQTQQQLLPDRSGQKDFWPKALTEAKKPVRETVRMLKQELDDMSYDPTGWRGVPSRYTLDHPELYAAYPELASVPIKQRYQKGAEKGSMSMQGGKLSDIEVNDASNPRSVALHEMQHAVQAIEGMSPGASPLQAYATPEWKRMYTENLARHLANEPAGTVPSRALEDKIANEAAFRWYERQQGEAEARATQARRDMGNTERAQSYPYNSYDVPENQLLTKAPLPYVGKAAGGTVKDYIRITERKL